MSASRGTKEQRLWNYWNGFSNPQIKENKMSNFLNWLCNTIAYWFTAPEGYEGASPP